MMLSLLIPTRGQVVRLDRAWRSLLATVRDWRQLEVIFRIDDDDPETASWMHSCRPRPVVVVGERGRGYADIPKMMNAMAKVAHGDLLMCGNDDMVFKTVDWPARYLEAAAFYPDGLFNFGCMTYPAGAFPFSCVSKKFVERVGYLNDERLTYSDYFLRDVFVRFGRTILLDTVEIQHLGEADREAQLVKARAFTDGDDYWHLHTTAVTQAVAKLVGGPRG